VETLIVDCAPHHLSKKLPSFTEWRWKMKLINPHFEGEITRHLFIKNEVFEKLFFLGNPFLGLGSKHELVKLKRIGGKIEGQNTGQLRPKTQTRANYRHLPVDEHLLPECTPQSTNYGESGSGLSHLRPSQKPSPGERLTI